MNFIESIGDFPSVIDNYTLVWAMPDKAAKITRVVNAGYEREITRKEGVPRYPDPSEILGEIEKVNQVGWLILQDPKEDNTIIGSLEIVEEKLDKYKINGFAIDKAYSGKNLGTRMLAAAELALRNIKVKEVFLEVISVAKQKLPTHDVWTTTTEVFEAEPDRLADFYQKHGFKFTKNSVLTPISWQKECRKGEYVGRVFFREMRKPL